jgi:DNA repair protein RecN (Recombination protein N)
MLVELIVENYAVVEQARIHFHKGLNLLTGETGSGKSIVVDSLSLLFGARASADMIRTGAQQARVSGIFSISGQDELGALLQGAGIELEDQELIVQRDVTAAGKSRAFVANRPVTTSFLKQIGPFLGDIHGQNEQQLLFNAQTQRNLLDRYAGAVELRERLADSYGAWRDTQRKLDDLRQNEQEKLRLLDLWRFQRDEIESAGVKSREDSELELERRLLQNSTKLQENAASAFEILYESKDSAVSLLRQALKRIDDLVRIDASLADTSSALKQAEIAVEEASVTLRDYLGKLESDPGRLEEVEARLDALDKLRRKYGGTLDEVLAFREQAARQVDEVEHATEHQEALEKEQKRRGAEYAKLAAELGAKRRDAAERLGKEVEIELKSLAMGATQFRVVIKPAEPSATGTDEIQFLVSPNRGEDLRPMEKIASGGELSRMALALKTAMGDTDASKGVHTLVFDEVDAGVGGAAAASVGRRLKALSRSSQVICVTHLAQIAGFADHHYAVSKRDRKGRAMTEVSELSRDERAKEIGRMLSGETITPEALKQAEQLIQAGQATGT